MAIQNRRGDYSDFDPEKMLPGEWGIPTSGDPNSEDGTAAYMCFKPGVVKRMATHDDMKHEISEVTADIIKQAKEEVTEDTKAAKASASAAAESAKTAEAKATAAESAANTAEAKATAAAEDAAQANTKAAEAKELAQQAKTASDAASAAASQAKEESSAASSTAAQAKSTAEEAMETASQANANASKAAADSSAAKESAENAVAEVEKCKESIATVNANFSDEYQNRPYTVGETCIHNNALYKAKQDITAAEDWNPEHWERTTVEELRRGVEEEIEKITPDDTAIDGKPWSSKHIVDMLCPPLEVTGNLVQCYPVEGYPLGIVASWKPTQKGTGDPSPDNIRAISGRGMVGVERCGENLFRPIPDKKTSNCTVSTNANGELSVIGSTIPLSVWSNSVYRPKAIYTIGTDKVVPKGMYVSVTEKGREKLILNYNTVKKSGSVDGTSESLLYLDKGTYDYKGKIALVIGSSFPEIFPSPYNGEMVKLTLPHMIYGGSVDAVTGEGQETWKLITLNGTETWESNSNKDNDRMFFETNVAEKYTDLPISGSNIDADKQAQMCSHLTVGDPYSYDVDNCFWVYYILENETARLRIRSTTNWTTSDELKSYLANQYAAGTPVQIAYKLAEPVAFTATGGANIVALPGTNTVITNADEVTVTGRADPIKKISDLESLSKSE